VDEQDLVEFEDVEDWVVEEEEQSFVIIAINRDI